MTIEEKLRHFQDYSMESANLKSSEMLEEYTSALEQIFQDHKEQKIRQANLQIKTETEQLKREMNKTLSAEQLVIKRKVTEGVLELKNKLFVEVKDRLASFMETKDYLNLLAKQITEAKRFAREDEIIIYIDPADSARRAELEMRTGIEVHVSEYSFKGGMRAVIPKRHILIDNSFETRLSEAFEAFSFTGGNFHDK